MTVPASSLSIAGRKVGPGERTFLIAEVGSNHNRDRKLAHRLIDETAQAGWDAVKFQLFRADWLYPDNCGVVDTPSGKVDFFEVLKQAELPPDWIPELRGYAESRGLAFLCTPFDEEAALILSRDGVHALKIASPELNHLPLLRACAATRLPLIASTGLCTLSDVEEALSTIASVDDRAQLAVLQCVTAYPAPDEDCNLAVLETLHRAFGVPVGYSDHTLDPVAAPAVAVAVGACILEKHVTLDRALEGPDHAFAITPQEMHELARIVRELDGLSMADRRSSVEHRFGLARVKALLGHGRKEIMPSEAPLYPCDKRSIHVLRDLDAGVVLTSAFVRIVRSERNLTPGLHPRHWDDVMGARLRRPVSRGQGLQWKDLLG